MPQTFSTPHSARPLLSIERGLKARVTFLLLALTCLTHSLSAQQIKAEFTPNTIYPDQLTKYVLSITSSQTPNRIDLPDVKGLSVVGTNSSRNISFSTGRGTTIVSNFEYTIRAERAGDYTMPAFTISIEGHNKQVPAARLKVLPMSAQRQQQIDQIEKQKEEALERMFSIKANLPEGEIYFGQAIPIEINLYIKNGLRANLENIPQKVGDSFSSTPFSDQGPEQTQTQGKDGTQYHLFTWRTLITPLKTGKQTLSFSYEAVIGIPKQRTLSNRRRSFFDDFFGGDIFYDQQRVVVYTDEAEVEVIPVPDEKKPESFTGGIGLFTMNDLELSDTRVKAGEPVTLTLSISGQGNFNRLEAPELTQVEGWQVYDPEERFIASDALGFQGTKNFEYTIIPQNKDITTTPNLTFSFFDPRSENYISFTAKSREIEVIPSKTTTVFQPPTPQVTSQQTASGPEEKQAKKQRELLPIKLVAGSWTKTIEPILKSPTFLAGQALPLFLIVGLALFRRQQLRLLNDEHYARKTKASKAVQTWLSKAKDASDKNDAAAFYEAAVRTVQEFIGGSLKQEPTSLTLAEIESHLVSCQAEPEQLVELNELFEATEALKFSGGTATLSDPAEEYSKLQNLIQSLQKIV